MNQIRVKRMDLQAKEQKKNMFLCTSKEIAIILKMRSLQYGKIYVIVEGGSPRRIGLVEKMNLDDNIVSDIVLNREGNSSQLKK